MSKIRKRRTVSILLITGIALLVAAAAVYCLYIWNGYKAGDHAEKVMKKMQEMIPQFDENDEAATGLGEDPLPMISIDGVSFVGYLDIPSQNLKLPVVGAESNGKEFAFLDSGSPVKGHFWIGGRDVDGIFGSLSKIKPGETIRFIDVNGVRYSYLVTGMGSIKSRAEAKHDLVLYRGLSRNISMAVFGTMQ